MNSPNPTQIWLVLCLAPAIIFFLGVMAGSLRRQNKSTDAYDYLPGTVNTEKLVERMDSLTTTQKVEDGSNE